jgi:hypothetical protein
MTSQTQNPRVQRVTARDLPQIVEIQNQTLYSTLASQGYSSEEISKIGFHLVPFTEQQLLEISKNPSSLFIKYENPESGRGIEAYAFGFDKETARRIVPRFERDVVLDNPSLDPRDENYFFFRQIVKRKDLQSKAPIMLEKGIINLAFDLGYPVICGEICTDSRYDNRVGLDFHTRVGHFKRFGEVLVGGESKFKDVKLGCYYLTEEMFRNRGREI